MQFRAAVLTGLRVSIPSRRAVVLPVLVALVGAILGPAVPGIPRQAAAAVVHLPNFQITTAIDGLEQPSAVEFAPDGRVFVTETAGVIKAFDSIDDPTPTVVADMRSQVHAIGDRGMLGLALDPAFSSGRPYLYVTYTQDAPPGGTPPHYNDDCPRDPVSGAANRCPATGRLVRIGVNASNQKTSETILIGGQGDNFWCHHGRQHAIGHAMFGPDGQLYVSSGEGSASIGTDYGQQTSPANPCGDPPSPVGTALSVPTTEGGALRSQDLRTSADPAQGSGAIVRVNPDTGVASAGNPLLGGASGTDDRHIAYGLRNPFRFTFRPGTPEIWVSDVGWNTREEVNRILNPTDATVENFGWPCYEGAGRQPSWDALDVNMCENLYAAAGAVTQPYWHYGRNAGSPGAPECRNAGGAVSAIAFSEGAPFPAAYNGALFVGDYVMGCLWALRAGPDGLPSAANLDTILSGVFPVELEIGPDGALYLVDIVSGRIERITYFGGNQPPIARATATPASGPVPLTVQFSGSGSTDDGPLNQLTYAWDLDGDGAFDDANGVNASRTYNTGGSVRVGLRVTDGPGSTSTAFVTVNPGNTPPTATIVTPTASTSWAANQDIGFSGSGSDGEDGTLGAGAMRWSIILHHCQTATDCHAHPQSAPTGISSGTFVAPEHEYPAHLEIRLTVTDSGGLTDTATVRLDPRTVDLTFRTVPAGLTLSVESAVGPAPLIEEAIVNSPISVTAPTPQTIGGVTYDFTGWSDGGAASHDVRAGSTNATYTASYQARPDKSLERQWGANRYATAATISANTFSPGVDVVYIATGTSFADALAAGPAASADGGPVLLVRHGDIPAETRTELARLNPDRIVVAGGTASISASVEQQLAAYGPVTREGGSDRYDTAAGISSRNFAPGVAAVYVATGVGFADALAAGPAAAAAGGPVLLVRGGGIPASTAAELDRLNPQQIVIVGGTSVVSSTVQTDLGRYSPSVVRRAGVDRYGTAAAISRASFASGVSVAYVASGIGFPDALAAGPAAAARGGPVLLVKTDAVPAATETELDRLQPDRTVIAGGTAVVSSGVEAQLAK